MQVVEVSPDPGGGGFRVHGSMKVVDQDNGHDLDPTGQMAAQKAPGVCVWWGVQVCVGVCGWRMCKGRGGEHVKIVW
jgi:hypothetical protein